MKIFDQIEGFEDKTNFVDENNIVLGFDRDLQCCEVDDWFISDEINPASQDGTKELEDEEKWRFDPEFFYTDSVKCNQHDSIGHSLNIAVFRIVNAETGGVKYIHICNSQNGYYCHGFVFVHKKAQFFNRETHKWEERDHTIQEGSL